MTPSKDTETQNPKPTEPAAQLFKALKDFEKKTLEQYNDINTKFETISTSLETISHETSKIEDIKSAVTEIKTCAQSTDRIVKEILVHGMDAHVVLDYLNEVTLENTQGSVLVVSELGRGFTEWMAENKKEEHGKHPEIFETTWQSVGKVLAEMFDALSAAGEFTQYKRNYHSRSNVILGRLLKPNYSHLEWSGRGVVSKGKGKGKGRAKVTAREKTNGKGKGTTEGEQ
ncbi:hypothetical protein HK104_005125 [Borealophlyctis nickersoniae]|nr:hypothetical protein HK104_005125 [Borealophlyctis nickersoniae]